MENNRPVAKGRGSNLNPPNRFGGLLHVVDLEQVEQDQEYLAALSNPATEYLPDHARTIISENDSPDLPFRYSLNPYRGCLHGCAYCLSGETPILMGDGTTKPLAELTVGDDIYGTIFRDDYHRLTRTKVLAHWRTKRLAYRVRLADGTELVASADHRFLSERGWKHVAPAPCGQRPYLTTNNHLLGTGRFHSGPAWSADYRRGYLTGMIRGDGTLRVYDYSGRRRTKELLYQFRLALCDQDALERSADYLRQIGVKPTRFLFQRPTESRAAIYAVRTSTRSAFHQISAEIAWPERPSLEWRKGYLAGFFDAEGCFSGSLRFFNSDPDILHWAEDSLNSLDFSFTHDVDKQPVNLVERTLRLRGGLREYLRFFHTVGNAIGRKRRLEGVALKSDADTRVVSVEPLGIELPMYDITTGTGDFLANGIVSHNCYARPTHEYLGLNAGLDFETKILVKEAAPELFRDFLARDTWRPEPITLSGVTDPYQPVERERQLTRRCVEIAVEANQPLSIITKNALVCRDGDLFADMARLNLVHVTLAVTTLDAELARSMEPRTSTPAARLRAVKELTDVGVPVRVLIAPVIPGLNDSEIPAILAAAKEAGAKAASFTMLRLPFSVAPVFLDWLERTHPAQRERIEGRIREVRGGKLNDPEFGSRMRGSGALADQIAQLFRLFARRHGLDGELPAYNCTRFRPPRDRSGQGLLF